MVLDTIRLNDLTTEIHEWAKSKGWWEPPKSFEEQLALYHSEVSEALEHFREGHEPDQVFYTHPAGSTFSPGYPGYVTQDRISIPKPDGIPVELADLVIRALDTCGYYQWRLLAFRIPRLDTSKTFGEHVYYLHRLISETVQTPWSISAIIAATKGVCDVYQIDLEYAIGIKMTYNQTRSQRHGGKRV